MLEELLLETELHGIGCAMELIGDLLKGQATVAAKANHLALLGLGPALVDDLRRHSALGTGLHLVVRGCIPSAQQDSFSETTSGGIRTHEV